MTMPTLVEQLRALARCEHGDMTLGNDAADEIERLQTELAAAKSVQPEPVARCSECGARSTADSMLALYCLDCSQEFVPALNEQGWRNVVTALVPDGVEQACDECGGDASECPASCPVRKARAMLASTPPAQPLTDEQIYAALVDIDGIVNRNDPWWLEVGRAIERLVRGDQS